MCDIHAIEIIPSQAAIDSIAIYRTEFDNKSFNYKKLLKKMKKVIHELKFMKKHDNAKWMRNCGSDYLANPKLFCHAPLTYICAFLGELFNSYELEQLEDKLTPQILKCALTRLDQFH